ncbi:unnamed protein product [Amaranthus hypochondriacus]
MFNSEPELDKISTNWKKGKTRNYYPRPTPPDVQFEERAQFGASSYNGESIHEWNLDGRSEFEILSLLNEMYMATVAYSTKGLSPPTIAMALSYGFSGQLRGWWDNYLLDQDRDNIVHHTKETFLEE